VNNTPQNTAPKRVLVTGGSGFIGSHLVELLLTRGDHVTVIDNLSTGHRTNLPAQHDRLRFIEASVADALPKFKSDESFDEIYHLAAAVGVRLIVSDPIGSIENNIAETSLLLRFAQDRKQTPRVLIASSSEVYGKSAHSPFREDDDVLYGPTTVFRWSYAASKAIDEYLALAYFAQRNLPATVTRFFNTVGPRQVGEYGMVLPRFVGSALANKPLEVHGTGKQSRCFCDVRDVVPALPKLLSSTITPGQVYNIGSDSPITIAELADTVIRVLGSSSPIQMVDYATAFNAPKGGFEDLQQRRPDLTKVRAAIGFAPSIPLEKTIKDIAEIMNRRA
jgi:UDP-glucose 4-epimerase